MTTEIDARPAVRAIVKALNVHKGDPVEVYDRIPQLVNGNMAWNNRRLWRFELSDGTPVCRGKNEADGNEWQVVPS
jgi:hypothetical protein